MTTMTQVRERHISMMQKTLEVIGNVLKNVSQEQATILHDGPDGWTILEVLCHLRDFDGYFHGRAVMMLEQDHSQLPAYDHEALAIEREYNSQDMAYVFYELKESREGFVEFFQQLSDEQWERTGVHPERGSFTMTDALMQVGLHDLTHIEQITRILEEEVPDSGEIPDEGDDE